MATVKDIAKLAGVSTATVSNVLNGKHGAAGPAKSKEIFDIAAELQYHPNILAKSLKQQKTNTIGIITEDLTVFNTPEIVDGINACCEDNGYELLLENLRLYKRYDNNFTDTVTHRDLFQGVVKNLIAKQVEGIIYVGYHCREVSYMPSSLGIKVPFVYSYCFPKEPRYPVVLFDDERAAFEATQHLIEMGHTKIGVITGPLESSNSQRRLLGFQKALYEGGVLYNAASTLTGDWSKEKGFELSAALLDMGVTAIFAFNDTMAAGVYAQCACRKLAVGSDISVMGYDNADVNDVLVPLLSSVGAPLSEMGRKSAELVIQKIRGKHVENTISFLPCNVYIRDSIAKCKKQP